LRSGTMLFLDEMRRILMASGIDLSYRVCPAWTAATSEREP
jgi:hypothetical protein